MASPSRKHHALSGSPFLTHVALRDARGDANAHPFNLPVLQRGLSLEFTTPVTFLVGENGSGKSTLLEAIAWKVGFGTHGGSRDHHIESATDGNALGEALRLGWSRRTSEGFFHRAETFHNFTSYLESVGSTFSRYGGASFHARSHGEGFLALFEHRFEDGLYLLDEPEAALSPQRQLALLGILHRLSTPLIAQFVIATHSPILLAFPGATILSFDGDSIVPVTYQDTDHYRVTRDFLNDPDRFFRYLFADE